MRKFVKYGLTIICSALTGVIGGMVLLERDKSKIKKDTKFECSSCPYNYMNNCFVNERIINEDDFVRNVPSIISEHVLKYYPKRVLRPLCLLFLHYDSERARVVCYSYKQEKIVYVNVDCDDINNVKISVTAR